MTSKYFPSAPIGAFAKQVSRAEEVTAGRTYRQIGVRLWGKGVYEREATDGTSTRYQTLFRVKTDDIVFNKIWARSGSVGVVPHHLNGCFGSGEFPTFEPDKDKIDPRWFHWFVQTRVFWERCAEKSYGTSGKNRIKPQQILEIEIPLPPLPEQQRIVARIEALAGKIEAARGLRGEAAEEVEALADSLLVNVFGDDSITLAPLRDVADYQRGRFSHRPRNDPQLYGGSIPFIQINDIPRNSKTIVSYSQSLNEQGLRVSRVFPKGTIVISIAATIGAVAVLGFDSCMPDSLVGLQPRPKVLEPDYIYHYLRYSQRHLQKAAPQSAQKNINIKILDNLSVPLLSLTKQREVVNKLNKQYALLNKLREAKLDVCRELDALLPAVLDRAFKGEL